MFPASVFSAAGRRGRCPATPVAEKRSFWRGIVVEDLLHAVSLATAGIRADVRRVPYIWRVPRWAAQRRVRSISMMSVATRTTIDRGELPWEIDSASAAN